MKFSLKHWYMYYEQSYELGKVLKSAQSSFDDQGVSVPPKIVLTVKSRKGLQDGLANIARKCGNYLDHCGIKMPPPLWHYNADDPTTWASHKSFKYGHLVDLGEANEVNEVQG